MQTTFALAALASVAYALPQAATNPPGCSANYNGKFQITIVNGSSVIARDLETRQTSCGSSQYLTSTLQNGILTDSQGRIGNIVANNQFQFDPAPGQTGAIYTSGWSVCQNGSLAIGGSAVFQSCASGDFANLYNKVIAPYCKPVYINVMPCSGSGAGQQPDGQPTGPSTVGPVTQIGDGQPQAGTSVAPVTQIGDGQLQGPTGVPVTQIGDGQLQAPTGAPVAQIPDGQLQVPTGKPVTQIGDGQLQVPTAAPTGKPVTQIGDGQLQVPTTAPTGKPVTQIGDGQLQVPTAAPTAKPVTQIPDGQLQVPTAAPSGTPVTQIPDGQLQVPTGAPVTQIPDGQLQTNASTTSPAIVNGGNTAVAGSLISAVVAFAAALLL